MQKSLPKEALGMVLLQGGAPAFVNSTDMDAVFRCLLKSEQMQCSSSHSPGFPFNQPTCSVQAGELLPGEGLPQ